MKTDLAYFGEFRAHWRAVAASMCALGTGVALHIYTASLFAPHLLAEFGWSKAQFALIGMSGLLAMVFVPAAGRLADLVGVRRTASIGIIGVPLCFIGFTLIRGAFWELFVVNAILMIVGTATTPAVVSRPIAERFERARGLALAIGISGSALIGACVVPLLEMIISAYGWKAAYRSLAVFALALGLLALTLVPPSPEPETASAQPKRRASKDYPIILRSGAFWTLLIAMFLCNLPQSIPHNQLKLVLLENGMSGTTAAMMISLYAIGVICGRFACGLALDRFPAATVAAIAMALPALGLFLLASAIDAAPVLALCVLLIGLSQGAEGDLVAYLVVRQFGIKLYGSICGLVFASIGLAGAAGAALLSVTLRLSTSYDLFLMISGVGVLVGSAIFLRLRGRDEAEEVKRHEILT